MSNRNVNVDMIRIVACIAVVGLHAFPKDISKTTGLIYYFFGFAVPFFFMSSGYFLLNRGKIGIQYSKKKCLGIIKLTICWNTVIIIAKILKHFIMKEKFQISIWILIKEYMGCFLQKGTLWQFWYLGALLILYLILPFLSRMDRHIKRIFFIVMGIVSIVFEINSLFLGKPLQKYVIQTFRLWTWLFYFMLGGEIIRIVQWFKKRINIILHFAITVVVTIFVIEYQNYIGTNVITEGITKLHAEYFYDSFLEMLWTVVLFTLLLRINIHYKIRNIICNGAGLTLGVYIIHPLILKSFDFFIKNPSLIRVILYWITTVVCTMLITWLINKTNLNKYLLKI